MIIVVVAEGRRFGASGGPERLVFDDISFPFVQITLPSGETFADDIEYMFKRYDAVFARREKHVLLVDTTHLSVVPSAAIRQRIKDFEDRTRGVVALKNHGSAIVLTSGIVRGAMTALRWISPAPAPNAYFGNVPEAALWCVGRLQKAGVAVPSRLAELSGATPRST